MGKLALICENEDCRRVYGTVTNDEPDNGSKIDGKCYNCNLKELRAKHTFPKGTNVLLESTPNGPNSGAFVVGRATAEEIEALAPLVDAVQNMVGDEARAKMKSAPDERIVLAYMCHRPEQLGNCVCGVEEEFKRRGLDKKDWYVTPEIVVARANAGYYPDEPHLLADMEIAVEVARARRKH